jgi:signal transduction histidine kinase
MQIEQEKISTYIRIKWLIVLVAFLFIVFEHLIGIINNFPAIACYIGFGVISINSLLFSRLFKKGLHLAVLSNYLLLIDLLVILGALYLNGGPETPWGYLPILVVFSAGYIFDFKTALVYALFAFLGLSTMYLLEYFALVPHFSLYGWPSNVWRDPRYLVDYSIGLLLLFFAEVLLSTGFSQTLLKVSGKQQQALKDSEQARTELETSRKALLNIMADFDSSKAALETKVKERTAELEAAKSGLEKSVSERTVSLEESRKAILHMMKDLKEDMAKLQTIDRMKTEFLSMVSHELRTPITPIKGYLSFMLSGKMGPLSDSQTNALQILSRQSEHLEGLIESLLDVSRLELGKPIPTKMEPLSIKKVIEEVAEALKITMESRGLTLNVLVPDDLPTILADEVKIRRILTNLVGNSQKFTPKGGEISINASANDQEITIEVVDNGIGIAREYLLKVFDKFYQVDSTYTRAAGGIGMGLAIVKELVELHGGRVRAESAGLGKGVKMIFTLPVEKKAGQ